MSGGTSGYPDESRSKRSAWVCRNPDGNLNCGSMTQIILLSTVAECSIPRWTRYSSSFAGNVIRLHPWSELGQNAGIYLRWRSEEPKPVLHFNFVVIPDLEVGPSGNHLPQISVGTDRRRRHMPNLLPSQNSLVDGIVISVDLDLKFLWPFLGRFGCLH
jgi:hypothetical protein